MRLHQVTKNIWYAERSLKVVGLFHFQCKMVIIRLLNGDLLLHSPISINDSLAEEIHQLGEVKYLIAPNCFHHLFLQKVQERYPKAKLYVAPGLPEKRKDLKFDQILTEQAPPEWSEELEQKLILGAPKINEVVFLHKATKTLIVTDLLFNMKEIPGIPSKLIFWMVGVYKKLAQSKLWKSAVKDKVAAKKSTEDILRWDFTRLIVAHGEILEQETKQKVQKALHWMLR